MAINIFFTYLGSLFALSIALSMLVPKLASGYAGQGKKPFFYGAFSSLIASVVTYLATFVSENLFTVFWIFAGVYLIFGIIHVKMVQKKYFTAGKTDQLKVFAGEVLFSISIILFTIVVFSSLQYFVTKDKEFIFYPMMMSTLAFIIPTLFTRTFEAAYAIPAPDFHTWRYPINQPIDLPPEDVNEKLLVIGFEIAKKSTDAKATYFRAKAPENIKFGELYYHFINDYNDLQSETPIEYADGNNIAYEWWFRLKRKWYQSNKVIDPMVSFRENGIIENSVIICERILPAK